MQAQMRQAMPKRYFCPVRSTSVSVTSSLIGAQLNTGMPTAGRYCHQDIPVTVTADSFQDGTYT
jgi:hypothetical protein